MDLWNKMVEDFQKLWSEDLPTLEGAEEKFFGSFRHSWQAIVDIWEVDCGGQWLLYVKTAVAAAGKALILVITPSMEEVLENYLEPKDGRRMGRRGQRNDRSTGVDERGRPITKHRRGIPDVDEAIAAMLPGAEWMKSREMYPGEHLFWKHINAADRILWWYLLVQVGEEFVTEWQSGLMQSGECLAPNAGSCHFNINERDSFFQPHLWFDGMALANRFAENLEILNNGHIQLPILTTIARWMIIIEVTWVLVNNSDEHTDVFEFETQINGYDKNPMYPEVSVQITGVAVPPNTTITHLHEHAAFLEKSHDVQHNIFEKKVDGGGATTVACTVNYIAAVRDVKPDV